MNQTGSQDDIDKIYKEGESNYQRKDYKLAIQCFEEAAKFNHPNALFRLGFMYSLGEGISQDHNRAKEYYEKAGQLKHSKALNNLGYMYDLGEGVPQDYQMAQKYYEKAIELGDVNSMNNLAILIFELNYFVGQNIPNIQTKLTNISRGIQLLLQAYQKSGQHKYLNTLYKYLKEDKNMFTTFVENYFHIQEENTALYERIKDLENQIYYQPGGPGYFEAKSNFESLKEQS